MPLSEQEQRLLEEMERGLYQNDADFVATVGQRRGKTNYTIVVLGVLLGILGIATLLGGVIIHQPLVGVLGFIIMFLGVLLAIAPPRRLTSARSGKSRLGKSGPSGSGGGRSSSSGGQASGGQKSGGQKSGTFMDGLNDRWEKRQNDRGQGE